MPKPKPTMRERVDRELRGPVRLALLGDRPLPSDRWKRVHAGRGRPLGVGPELARDAGIDLSTALRRLADVLDAAPRAA